MTYVLSDIHGNERRFDSILKQICLHPDPAQDHGHAQMLLGNHEYMMLRALGCPYDDYADDGRALEHRYRLRQRLSGRRA